MDLRTPKIIIPIDFVEDRLSAGHNTNLGQNTDFRPKIRLKDPYLVDRHSKTAEDIDLSVWELPLIHVKGIFPVFWLDSTKSREIGARIPKI